MKGIRPEQPTTMLLVLSLAVCVSVASAFQLSMFDPEACVTSPATPITRVIEASDPLVFTSPNFNFSEPADYPENTICQWSIYLENYTDTLLLGFYNFSIEDDIDCSFDSVTVWDGPDDSETPIVILCGELGYLPEYFTASNGSFFVRFVSDGNGIVGKGFAGRAGPPIEGGGTACDGNGPQVFTNPQGIFQTKDFPIHYNNGVVCEYSFQAPEGQKIEVSFTDFDLAQNCNDDFLEAFEGEQLAIATLAASFSGNMNPSIMTTVGNGAYLRLTTNLEGTSTGFRGSYRFIPA